MGLRYAPAKKNYEKHSGEAQRQGADSPHERLICGRGANGFFMRQPKKTMKNTRGKPSGRGQTAPMSD